MKFVYLVVTLLVSLSADPQKSSLTTVFGDLDGDNIEEKVLMSENKDGQRMLQIFKQNNSSEWKLWHSFDSIVINSDDGGAMGDPFTVETLDYNLSTGKAIYTANCIGDDENQDECIDIKNFTFYVKPQILR